MKIKNDLKYHRFISQCSLIPLADGLIMRIINFFSYHNPPFERTQLEVEHRMYMFLVNYIKIAQQIT